MYVLFQIFCVQLSGPWNSLWTLSLVSQCNNRTARPSPVRHHYCYSYYVRLIFYYITTFRGWLLVSLWSANMFVCRTIWLSDRLHSIQPTGWSSSDRSDHRVALSLIYNQIRPGRGREGVNKIQHNKWWPSLIIKLFYRNYLPQGACKHLGD